MTLGADGRVERAAMQTAERRDTMVVEMRCDCGTVKNCEHGVISEQLVDLREAVRAGPE